MAPFLLFKLPHVPNKRIIKLMSTLDVVKLSMCSARSEIAMKKMNYKIEIIHIHLNDKPQIEVNESITEYCDIMFNMDENFSRPLGKNNLSVWYITESGTEMNCRSIAPIHDCLSIAKRLRNIFNVKLCEYLFDLNKLTTINPKKLLLSNVLVGGYDKVTIGGLLDSDNLNHIMNTANMKTSIHIASYIPENFKHGNAMKFYSMNYDEACWVKMDDVKLIRNCFSVNLGTTNFDYYDINQFLHYWVNCEQDMMRSFEVKLKKETVTNETDICKGLRKINIIDSEIPKYYIIAREELNRKFIIGLIQVKAEEKIIVFETFPPEKNLKIIPLTFRLLDRKQQLEDELLGIEKEERKYLYKWNINERGFFEEKIQELRVRTKITESKLDEVRKELVGLNYIL